MYQRFECSLQVLYRYESLAGYGLMILGPVGWCMFIYSTFFTLKHYPEKGGFYYPFFCFYTLYFIASPTIIVISNHVIAEWVREKVREGEGEKKDVIIWLIDISAINPSFSSFLSFFFLSAPVMHTYTQLQHFTLFPL